MGITIYKRNAAMCSIVHQCKFVRDFILIINRGAINCLIFKGRGRVPRRRGGGGGGGEG